MTRHAGNLRARGHKAKVIRNDGSYANAFLAVGTEKDRGRYTRRVLPTILQEQELISLYVGDGFARRIIDTPAEDMTRAGFSLEGFDGGEAGDGDKTVSAVMAALENVDAIQKLTTALRWSGLFGGALVVMIVNDGNSDLTQPLNLEGVKGLDSLRVYDRYRVTRKSYYDDPNDKRFGRPQIYTISPPNGMQYSVHESRCLIFDGVPVPDQIREMNAGWGASKLQAAYTQLERFGLSHYWANAMLERAQQAVHGITGLSAILRSAGGKEQILERVNLVDMARSINNTVVIDAEGETYELKSTSFTGLTDIIDRIGEALCAVTGMPATLLLGKQQKGIANGGEGDLENWYALISQDQNLELRGPLDTLVQICLRAMGNQSNDYLITFNPLWVSSDKERAEVKKLEVEMQKMKAETAQIYAAMQALDPSEVRKSLAGEYEIDKLEQLSEVSELELDENGDPVTTKRADADPRPLLIKRELLNAGDVVLWAKQQGFQSIVAADAMHVTVLSSPMPVDPMKLEKSWGEDENGHIVIKPGGPRAIEQRGDGIALLFASWDLQNRHRDIIEACGSYEVKDYQPYITLCHEVPVGTDLTALKPYVGALEFGPELFETFVEKTDVK